MTTTVDLTFRRGEDWIIDFICTGSDDLPLNITGAVIEWIVDDAVVASTGGGEITITDAPAGAATISVDSADTGDIALGVQQHQCRLELGSGVKSYQFQGDLTVLEAGSEVTL